jgi:ubiquinone/menaquinone biosynthesis C-methylase UbiE
MTFPSGNCADLPPEFPHRTERPGAAGWILRAATAATTAALRFAYYLLYYPLAFTYDAVAWIVSAGEWADWRRCVIPFLPPGPVLEIAHGTGTLSLDLAAAGFPVTAVDLSPAMSRIASGKKRRRDRGAARPPAGPDFVRADVRRLPFRGNCFSSATATFPAEFFFDRRTIREAARVLRPGGRWIIVPSAYPEFLAARFFPDGEVAAENPLWSAFRQRLRECGMALRIAVVRRPRSRVLVLLAEKESPKEPE